MNEFDTHEVFNQAPPFEDVNLFACDPALREALAREGAGWAAGDAARAGRRGWAAPRCSTWRARPTPTRRGWSTSTAAGAASTKSSSTRPGTS